MHPVNPPTARGPHPSWPCCGPRVWGRERIPAAVSLQHSEPQYFHKVPAVSAPGPFIVALRRTPSLLLPVPARARSSCCGPVDTDRRHTLRGRLPAFGAFLASARHPLVCNAGAGHLPHAAGLPSTIKRPHRRARFCHPFSRGADARPPGSHRVCDTGNGFARWLLVPSGPNDWRSHHPCPSGQPRLRVVSVSVPRAALGLVTHSAGRSPPCKAKRAPAAHLVLLAIPTMRPSYRPRVCARLWPLASAVHAMRRA